MLPSRLLGNAMGYKREWLRHEMDQLGKLKCNNEKRGGRNARGRGVGRVGGRGVRENQGRNAIVVAILDTKHNRQTWAGTIRMEGGGDGDGNDEDDDNDA
jgi:hypothetical protein